MAVAIVNEFASATLLGTTRVLGPLIWAYRDQFERDRRLPPALVSALARADMFRLLLPRALGGLEVDLLTAMRIVEDLAKVDGSAGWAVMIGNSGLFTAWLATEAGQEMVGADNCAPMGGALAPT